MAVLFPQPLSPTNPSDSPLLQLEAEPLDRAEDALRRDEVRREVPDIQQRGAVGSSLIA